jgi:hypothetical protein
MAAHIGRITGDCLGRGCAEYKSPAAMNCNPAVGEWSSRKLPLYRQCDRSIIKKSASSCYQTPCVIHRKRLACSKTVKIASARDIESFQLQGAIPVRRSMPSISCLLRELVGSTSFLIQFPIQN